MAGLVLHEFIIGVPAAVKTALGFDGEHVTSGWSLIPEGSLFGQPLVRVQGDDLGIPGEL